MDYKSCNDMLESGKCDLDCINCSINNSLGLSGFLDAYNDDEDDVLGDDDDEFNYD